MLQICVQGVAGVSGGDDAAVSCTVWAGGSILGIFTFSGTRRSDRLSPRCIKPLLIDAFELKEKKMMRHIASLSSFCLASCTAGLLTGRNLCACRGFFQGADPFLLKNGLSWTSLESIDHFLQVSTLEGLKLEAMSTTTLKPFSGVHWNPLA